MYATIKCGVIVDSEYNSNNNGSWLSTLGFSRKVGFLMTNDYSKIKFTIISLIDYVLVKLDDGVDEFRRIVDPSLDELNDIIKELMEEAKKHEDSENLNHYLFSAYSLIQDVKNGCDDKLGEIHKKNLKNLY